jgi:hypothetical protein
MGWYTIDETFNDITSYGYQKGCDFLNNICYSSTTYTEFCGVAANANIKSCSSQHFSKSKCALDTYSDGCGLWIS